MTTVTCSIDWLKCCYVTFVPAHCKLAGEGQDQVKAMSNVGRSTLLC